MTVVEQTREVFEQDELPDGLRWVNDLAPRHQRVFYAELHLEWSRYCLTGDPAALTEFFDDWKATAEADANREHAAFLLGARNDDDYEKWPTRAAG